MLHLSSSTSSKSSSSDKTKKKQVRFNERLHVVTVIECSEGNTSEDDQSKTRDDIAVLSRPTLSTMASSSLPFSSPRIRMTNQDNLPGWLHAGRKRMAEATTTTRSIHDIPPDLLSLPLPYQTTSLLSSVDCCRWYSNTSDQLQQIRQLCQEFIYAASTALEPNWNWDNNPKLKQKQQQTKTNNRSISTSYFFSSNFEYVGPIELAI